MILQHFEYAVIFLQIVRSFCFVDDCKSILDIVPRNACSYIDKQFALDATSGNMKLTRQKTEKISNKFIKVFLESLSVG